jgi:hypothetical protein
MTCGTAVGSEVTTGFALMARILQVEADFPEAITNLNAVLK